MPNMDSERHSKSNQLEKLEAVRDASFDYLWLTFLTFGYLSLPFLFIF